MGEIPDIYRKFVEAVNLGGDEEYSFIRVFEKDDRAEFVGSMREEEVIECYNSKSIKLDTWLDICCRCTFNNKYIVHRRGYWNEESGECGKSNNCAVLLYSIQGKTYFFKWPIKILLSNNKIIRLPPNYNIVNDTYQTHPNILKNLKNKPYF